MSKLEDLLGKKKEIIPVLDLSKTIVHTKEEYKRLLEKVPDYKMRPIKVRNDEIKIKDKEWTFKIPKKETRYLIKHIGERELFYQYLDPIPIEMRSIVILELCPVPIDWKMLTTLRPKSKIEEEYFSKLIELGKLQLKTEVRDKRDNLINNAVRKVKNKSGIIETKIYACPDCSEEFCNSKSCCDFNYDLYTRMVPKMATSTTNKMLTTVTSSAANVAGPPTLNPLTNNKKHKNKFNKKNINFDKKKLNTTKKRQQKNINQNSLTKFNGSAPIKNTTVTTPAATAATQLTKQKKNKI